ncbi:MAG TPA: DUF3551 domain-containing protein [Xanthobacteraceae bacterium]|nr:DUF3551 domain-containing protein [Xanthobacteraceae bacterium]
MRYVLIGGVLMAALIAGSASAQQKAPRSAENQKYCFTLNSGAKGAARHCNYNTLADCQASAKGERGSCAQNPKFGRM